MGHLKDRDRRRRKGSLCDRRGLAGSGETHFGSEGDLGGESFDWGGSSGGLESRLRKKTTAGFRAKSGWSPTTRGGEPWEEITGGGGTFLAGVLASAVAGQFLRGTEGTKSERTYLPMELKEGGVSGDG